jgi:two-component sensor histidine kinase
VVRYGITLIWVLLSFAVRHGVGDLAGPYGFILFVPALVISSLAFGWTAGLFAVAFSALVDGLWLDWSGPNFHATALATFVIIGACLVFLGDALRRALEGLNRARNENQMLLDEMSHRVKNKFAMIISVISLQSRAAPLEARPALEAVARRVHALASVHTHLQGSRQRGLVEMDAYLQDLVSGLQESAGHLRKVALSADAECLMFPPREATAVGLIVNELVMNCFKYAFPGERAGKATVSLRSNEESVLLNVSDDGIGCPRTVQEGMGTGLVSLLAAQLGGRMERSEATRGGCSVTVTFPMTSEMQRADHSNSISDKHPAARSSGTH